jgi:ribosomal RNA-processing protein 9
VAATTSTRLKTIQNVPTSVALTRTPASAFISTKSGQLFRFDRKTMKSTPIRTEKGQEGGHKGEILDIAASEDGKWLVSGGRDKIVGVWDVSGEGKWVAGMRGHKDAVTVSRIETGEFRGVRLLA